MRKIIYINSTLPARKQMSTDFDVSPLHNWGYMPRRGDSVLANRSNRLEIVTRAKLHGLDVFLLLSTILLLLTGRQGLYVVTQPDLRLAFPIIRKLFPTIPIVSWVWTAEEARKWHVHYKHCTQVLCLTEPARRELIRAGLKDSQCTFALWGVDPTVYSSIPCDVPLYDVLFFGITGRDINLTRKAINLSCHHFAISDRAATMLQIDEGQRISVLRNLSGHQAIVKMITSSRVVWIPLLDQPDPAGFTNLVESLLCGTSVVINDTSTIPSDALSLPGVFKYQVGNVESLLDATKSAIRASYSKGYRQRVRDAAVAKLNGNALKEIIARTLNGAHY